MKKRRSRIGAAIALVVLLPAGLGVVSVLAGINTDNSTGRDGGARHADDRFASEWDREEKIPLPEPVPDREPDLPKADAMAEEISRRISEHESLPRESLLGSIGLGVLANDQKNNSAAITEILDSLAAEIGATKAAGAIRVIQENREKQAKLEGLAKSQDPAVQKNSAGALAEIAEENKMLEDFVRQAFSNEGVELTSEQIHSLCTAPNAEDTASMISAFGSLKTISSKMEERLRWTPSQEQAQKYYGAHYAMLLALNKIQSRAMENIRDIYIPEATKIGKEAAKTSSEAKEILSKRGISPEETQALRWNIATCNKTVETAESTKKKLEKNLSTLSSSREKLAKSLATAKNCHTTVMLQKQILRLEGTASQEFARIEALTIPPLVAVNFSDPEKPEVSPPLSPRM